MGKNDLKNKKPQPPQAKSAPAGKKRYEEPEEEVQFQEGMIETDEDGFEEGEEEFEEGDFEGMEEDDLEDLEEGVEEGDLEDLGDEEFADEDGLAEGDEEGAEEGDEEGGEYDGEIPDVDEEMVGHDRPMIPIQNLPDDADMVGVDETLAETDTQLLKMKINSHLKVLSKFKELREEEKSRAEYITELKEYFCNLYGYNKELMDIFFNLFSPHECSAFLESMEEERPVTIRTNTIKARRKELAQALASRRVELEPVGDWSKVGLKINESRVPIGATPEYLGGQYMLQSACSFLPVLALAPRPGEKVLDMAAAPGGKTTYIGQMMKNQGVLVANDLKKERLKVSINLNQSLFYNVQRLGVTNCIVVNYDGRKIQECMRGFDKVLLDAPCTGLGVISRDQSIKANRTLLDVKKAAHMQRELLRAAIDCCKVGGTIVYSTCSIAAEENEGVIDYILRKRFVKIVETGLPIEKEGITSYEDVHYDPRVKMTRRVYPHMHNMDGFFIAKLIKLKDGPKVDPNEEKREKKPTSKLIAKISKKGMGKRDRMALKKGKLPITSLTKRAPETTDEFIETPKQDAPKKTAAPATNGQKQTHAATAKKVAPPPAKKEIAPSAKKETAPAAKKTALPSADELKARKLALLKKLKAKKQETA